ncbi:MAG: hypothetical protein U1G08_15165 [Verrucomicrobiota bacterium]
MKQYVRAIMSASLLALHSQGQGVPGGGGTNQQQTAVQTTGVSALEISRAITELQKVFGDQSKVHQEFLDKQAERHQLFLEGCYEHIKNWIIGIGILAGGILTLFGLKTSRDVKRTMERWFKGHGDEVVDKKLASFDEDLKKVRSTLMETVNALSSETNTELGNIARLVTLLTRATIALRTTWSDHELRSKRHIVTYESVLNSMAEFVKKYPAERTITVVIGRLKRELNDLAGAIDALDRCIQARNGLGLNTGPDHAALYFNKACYLNVLARNSGGRDGRLKALEALEECLKLCPEDLNEAKIDADLSDLPAETGRTWEDFSPAKKGGAISS